MFPNRRRDLRIWLWRRNGLHVPDRFVEVVEECDARAAIGKVAPDVIATTVRQLAVEIIG